MKLRNTLAGAIALVFFVSVASAQTNRGTSPVTDANTKILDYTIRTTDCSKTIQIGTGTTGYKTFTLPAATNFQNGCVVTVKNGDSWSGRGKALSGFPSDFTSGRNVLWPGQAGAVQVSNGGWVTAMRPGRAKIPNGTVNFYADFTNTNGDNAGNDCMSATASSGIGPCKTIQQTMYLACDEFDFRSFPQAIFQVNAAAGVTDTFGVHYACHGEPGAQGGSPISVVAGAGATISTVNTDAFALETGAKAAIAGFVIQATGTVSGLGTSRPADGLRSDYGAILFNGGNTFALAAGSHMAADNNGVIINLGNNIVNNNALTHYFAQNGGNINTNHVSILLTTTIQAGAAISIGSAWASAGPGGNINVPNIIYPIGSGASFSGTVLKALTTGTGAINTDAGTSATNTSYFPGNSNGTISAPFASWLLKRDLNPASNDNDLMWLEKAA